MELSSNAETALFVLPCAPFASASFTISSRPAIVTCASGVLCMAS